VLEWLERLCLLSVQKIYITTLDDRFGDRRPTLVQRLLYI